MTIFPVEKDILAFFSYFVSHERHGTKFKGSESIILMHNTQVKRSFHRDLTGRENITFF